jgi:hypothetical protein
MQSCLTLLAEGVEFDKDHCGVLNCKIDHFAPSGNLRLGRDDSFWGYY